MREEVPGHDRVIVGVVFGGRSGEHEVSVQSATSVMRALSARKYDVVPIGITKAGNWIMIRDQVALSDIISRGTVEIEDGPKIRLDDLDSIDVFFPVLHGTYGEDGTIQGFFEMIGKPYVGSGVLASSLAMDKALSKAVFSREGIPVVEHVLLEKRAIEADLEGAVKSIERHFEQYPLFVKPANLGSSVGITKAHDRSELIYGLKEAASYDRKVLVEEAIDCREVECSVLGNDDPEVSVPGEIIPCREFYDYVAKYVDNRSKLLIPAPLDEGVTAEVRDLALRAYKALDCCGMARVDFLLSKSDGKIYVSEVNTIPGFTNISMYPKLWEYCGLSYPELVHRLVVLGIQRYEERAALKTSYEVPKGRRD
ncbi:MAG TPA: D-alanine--D-alanine ligase [Clostridia bacterium]|nr:D-alanine--D-alanine ligase [Clostridia bacterium]